MPSKEKAEAQTFTFETMACVLAVMEAKGATLGNKAYDLMSELDGKRSASSFQHQFRAVKSRGKELVAALEDDAPAAKTPKSTKKTATSTGKKRGNNNVEAGDDDEIPETPSKKAKTNGVKKEPSEQDSDHGTDGYAINGNHFDNAMGPQ